MRTWDNWGKILWFEAIIIIEHQECINVTQELTLIFLAMSYIICVNVICQE